MELEGLRGVAAVVVVLHHFLYAFFPYLMKGTGDFQHMKFEDNIYGTPLSLLYAGTFAVAIFFVLSGFVLSIGYFQTKNEAIVKKLASKRYLRLMLPALAATLICFILWSVGGGKIIEATSSITQSAWLAGTWSGDTSLFDAVYSASIGIFISSGSAYNNVLWTMMIEFIGSFLVFGFLLLFARSRYRWVCYALLAAVTFNTWFLAFIIGMVLADLYSNGWLEKLKDKHYLILSMMTVGLVFGSFPHGRVAGTIYEPFRFLGAGIINHEVMYLTLGAALLITTILIRSRLGRMFSANKVALLGRYTFSMYLIHLAVLYTATSIIFLQLHAVMGYTSAAITSLFISVPIVGIVSWLFEKYVDAPSIRFAKLVSELYYERR